ncbi:MAG: fabH [Ilumatobacteraceae bacterium]|nr:fabH [Ilumatobacteraceae bacterium]
MTATDTTDTTTARPAPAGDRAPALAASRPTFGLRVVGLGGALGRERVTNHELARRLDTSDAWIRDRTGIGARRVAGAGESTTSLACEAARRALDQAGIGGSDVDLVVLATSTPDSPCPSTAARVAAALGLRAPGFDLNSACTGFVHALHVSAALMADPAVATVLVIGADRYTSLLDPDDRNTAILFGDGAGAALVTSAPVEPGGPGILASDLGGDTGALAVVEVPPGREHLVMDGPELFRRATRGLASSGTAALDRAGVVGGDVDLYVPHQANQRIINAAAGRLGIADGRVVSDVEERANTSSASIPLALEAAQRAGRLTPGSLVLLSGIGAGLAWSSLVVRWSA